MLSPGLTGAEQESLDGEGGYTVVGRLMPSEASLRENCLPLGLAHGWKLLEPVAAGQPAQMEHYRIRHRLDCGAVAARDGIRCV
jgi:predicted homoserine dehydrogenase-like protein